MSQSYKSLTRQIKRLQAEADALLRKESRDVVARIKEAIAHYELTAEDLFGTKRAGAAQPRAARSTGGYADGKGNTWSGHGRRPQWFLDAVASGRTPQSMLTGIAASPASAGRVTPGKRRSPRKGFTDGTNSWSGHGRRPQWFLDAIASGKTPEELSSSPAQPAAPAASIASTGQPSASTKRSKKPTRKRKAASFAGFSDGTNEWSGRGKRPQWFTDALASGKTPADLRAGTPAS